MLISCTLFLHMQKAGFFMTRLNCLLFAAFVYNDAQILDKSIRLVFLMRAANANLHIHGFHQTTELCKVNP